MWILLHHPPVAETRVIIAVRLYWHDATATVAATRCDTSTGVLEHHPDSEAG
jgi:aspartate aminotransferase-like enzyme